MRMFSWIFSWALLRIINLYRLVNLHSHGVYIYTYLFGRDPTPQALATGSTKWRQFIAKTTDYLAIGENNVLMRHNFRTARVKFWNELVPNVKRRIEQLKVAPQVQSGAVWPLVGVVIALLLLLLICLVVIFRMGFKARQRHHMNAIPSRL